MRYQLLTGLFLLLLSTAGAQTKNFLDQPYIEVTGNADTALTPDEIYIRITLSERDTRDRVPLEELEQKLSGALQALGIDVTKDLAASDFLSSYTSYALRGKEVTRTKQFFLKVNSASRAGAVFQKLDELNLGTALIDHVYHSDLEAIRNRMRGAAMANARARALALTRSLNQNVGSVLFISDPEDYNAATISQPIARGYYRAKGDNNPRVDFEKIRVNVSIHVKFALK
ncbi:SIMPL domain-containing protein [Flaviaesturariibacter terrae]